MILPSLVECSEQNYQALHLISLCTRESTRLYPKDLWFKCKSRERFLNKLLEDPCSAYQRESELWNCLCIQTASSHEYHENKILWWNKMKEVIWMICFSILALDASLCSDWNLHKGGYLVPKCVWKSVLEFCH